MHEYEVAMREAERGTSRLRELRLSARERPATILASALEELGNAIETLRASGEELRFQEELLVDSTRALEEERRRYQELFDFAADPMLQTDLNGTIMDANRAARDVLGAERCAAGTPLAQLFGDADRRRVRSTANRARHLQTAQELEVRVVDRRGEERITLLRVAASVSGQPPRAMGLRCSIRDLTTERNTDVIRRDLEQERAARERAELRRQRLVALLDTIHDPLFALDVNWRFIHANRAAARLFSAASTDELMDRDIWSEMPDAIGSHFYKMLTSAVTRGERTVFSDYYQPTRTRYNVHVFTGRDRTVVLLQPETGGVVTDDADTGRAFSIS